MNTTSFWRCVWKEYRQQRALWFAALMLATVLQLAFIMIQVLKQTPLLLPENGTDLATWLFSIALAAPVLYMLGSGAILFAGEHENETFAFQQALPITSSRFFAAKLAYAALSLLILIPVLWLIAWVMTKGALPEAELHAKLWVGCVVACTEVFVWAAIFSILWQQVLPAAAAAGATAGTIGAIALAAAANFAVWNQFDEFWATIPLRLGVVTLVGACLVYLGRRCFSEHPFPRRRREVVDLPGSRIEVDDLPWGRLASFVLPSSIRSLGHLVWLELRQSWILLSVLLAGYLVLSSFLGAESEESWLTLLPGLGTLFGACVFWSDKQRSRFRFFAERGVSPHWLWFSRMLVWASILIGVAAFTIAVFRFSPRYHTDEVLGVFGLTLLAFTAAQMGAMFTRSGIVGVFVGLMTALLAGAWTGLMITLSAPLWLAVAPLPVIFLFATWLYAPNWISERAGWRVRLGTFASLAVPLMAVWFATSAYRGYEVPVVALPIDLTELKRGDTPEARETWRMYEEAHSLLQRWGTRTSGESAVSGLTADQQRGLSLFVTASSQPSCRAPELLALTKSKLDARLLAQAVLNEAQRLDEQGELDKSLELRFATLNYAAHLYQQPHSIYQLLGRELEVSVEDSLLVWATRDQQAADRVRAALTQLTRWQQETQPRVDLGIAGDRELVRQLTRMPKSDWQQQTGLEYEQYFALRGLSWLLPWELQRSERVIDALAALQIGEVRFADQVLANKRALGSERLGQVSPPELVSAYANGVRRMEVESWLRSTPFVAMFSSPHSFATGQYTDELRRRVIRLQLALLAWRLEHGQLPEKLQDLLGHGLEALPQDPYTGTSFYYNREGLPIYEWSEGGMAGMAMPGVPEEEPKIIGHELPFLWSPGPNLQYAPVAPSYPDTLSVKDFWRGNLQLTTRHDLWMNGLKFPIPSATSAETDD